MAHPIVREVRAHTEKELPDRQQHLAGFCATVASEEEAGGDLARTRG